MNIIENVSYGAKDCQRLDVYLPEQKSFPVFVYFHGGALKVGDKAEGALKSAFCYLAERGVAVISANYTMYPDAVYPDFIEDAASVVAWAFSNMGSYGTVDGVYVGGSSAGGYLSMMLCFDKQWLTARKIDPLQIKGWFHDAGQPTAHFEVLRRSGTDGRRIVVDKTAPLYHVGLSSEHSPMRFIISDNDLKNRYEQTMLMLGALDAFGFKNFDHILMHGPHCEYCGKRDADGNVILGTLVLDFIKNGVKPRE